MNSPINWPWIRVTTVIPLDQQRLEVHLSDDRSFETEKKQAVKHLSQ
ncbi:MULTISPECIES: hypothetical protein [Cyanophyceae]|nr:MULTISPECIES: hypothetical protein [Cyanophyceae]MDB9356460.1 hypothetical protein [Nodularia spumigena CS-587/03]MDB9337860.1 hypothetical protein [Nodularia spumigena CS-589/07]MDB9402175.1 hypothetical protein [Microcystis aeruginosa CS-567/02-A1]MDB9500020.1 hypothetical protein [Nodularia spumigena CS-336/02]MDB9533108.1 hypothetical protein [Nodularia spumigena CS-1038]